MVLDEGLRQELKDLYTKLNNDGKLLAHTQLEGYYETFRKRFGPDQLKSLDGEALLDLMHDHGNHDSLVYWLEFKNDEEFPAARFGSIAGGSALKFGIYRRKETGAWMIGNPLDQREISIDDAIQYARRHRDQLVLGTQLLEQLPANGTDADYRTLQGQMDALAPDVSNLAWGHKYFSLLSPDKLDDYHNPDYQRYYLIKLLQIPPEGEGRYLVAGRYVAIAHELGVPLNSLTTILNFRDGRPYRYWRIGTSDGTQPRNRWSLMREGSCIAIGWPALGDLSAYSSNQELRAALRQSLGNTYYPDQPQLAGRKTQEVSRFVNVISDGDVVLASDGATVLGVGKIIGDYTFEPTSDFPHRRPVEWLSLAEWRLPNSEGLRTTVYQFKDVRNLVAIERHLLEASSTPRPPKPPLLPLRLPGLPGRIQSILERKSQVILYGPPGTGKTHWAELTARELAARSSFGAAFDQLSTDQKAFVYGDGHNTDGLVRMCCFHPGYGYEDFFEGYRPVVADGGMIFRLQDGIFKKLCRDAAAKPEHKFYLIIDEINRGDIPRIFGELLTGLEKNKRGKSLLLPMTGEPFQVPANVYLIGTMNTADRSIALLDTALRRRFGFIELMPDSSVLGDAVVGGIPLGPWLEALNRRLCEHIGRDARNLQIGHAYLLEGDRPIADFSKLSRVIQEEIIPLLEEYCYEDYVALEKILGPGLVDTHTQLIRHELFEDSRQDELVQALLASCPDIATTRPAVASEAMTSAEEDDDQLDDAEDEGQ